MRELAIGSLMFFRLSDATGSMVKNTEDCVERFVQAFSNVLGKETQNEVAVLLQ